MVPPHFTTSSVLYAHMKVMVESLLIVLKCFQGQEVNEPLQDSVLQLQCNR